jgi:hypothetical protein
MVLRSLIPDVVETFEQDDEALLARLDAESPEDAPTPEEVAKIKTLCDAYLVTTFKALSRDRREASVESAKARSAQSPAKG